MNFQLTKLTAILLLASNSCFAGHIEVVNENRKALEVKIQSEGDSLEENLATYNVNIPAEHFYKFSVLAKDLKSKSHFSIKGSTNPFTKGDKCEHLSVEKNYKVTFLNDTLGTSCIAEKTND